MENWIKWVIGISILLLTPILFKLLFVDFIDQHELGYKFDTRTGQISVLKEKGYIVSPPVLVKISTIDLRPFQVCINANSRVLNCKLIQFDPEGFDDFINWHGRSDYSPFSSGVGPGGLNTNSDMYQIMMAYAYESYGKRKNKNYKFLKVIKEIGGDDSMSHESQDIDVCDSCDTLKTN